MLTDNGNFISGSAAGTSRFNGSLRSLSKALPMPFLDPLNQRLPTDLSQCLKLCELIYYSSGVFQQAITTIVSSFVTDVEIDGVDGKHKDAWRDLLYNDLGIINLLCRVGHDYMVYGNSMISPKMSIVRHLKCGRCQAMYRITDIEFHFRAGSGGSFSMRRCPSCGARDVAADRLDYKVAGRSGISLDTWNLHRMKVKENPLTNRKKYFYELDPTTAAALKRGDSFLLEDTPWVFVQCALNNKVLEVYPDYIFHVLDKPLSGIDTGGIGMPRIMANASQAYLTMILTRINMALGLEYSMPYRCVTPMTGMPPGADMLDQGVIVGRVLDMLSKWDQDPSTIQYSSTPLQMVEWGGQGVNLTSSDTLRQSLEQLLLGIGVTPSILNGQFKSLPEGHNMLRSMERTWAELLRGLNSFLSWAGETLAQLLGWPVPSLKLIPTTLKDDEQLKSTLLQLYLQGRISGTTALAPLGLDPIKENTKALSEQAAMQSEADLKTLNQDSAAQGLQLLMAPQQEQAAQQAAGGQPASDAAVNNNTPMRPEQLQAKAEEIASQLINLPQEQRSIELGKLRDQNQALHGLVVQAVDKMRQHRGTDQAQAEAQAQQ